MPLESRTSFAAYISHLILTARAIASDGLESI